MTQEEFDAFKDFARKLKYEVMSLDDYEIIFNRLGGNGVIKFKRENEWVLYTMCHNINAFDGSPKLYFYTETKTLYCYTRCNKSMDIYELVKTRFNLKGKTKTMFQCVKWICEQLNIPFNFKEDIKKSNTNKYNWKHLEKYTKKYKSEEKETIVYNKTILDYFDKLYHTEWLDYGISKEVLDKYNIMWYNYKSQIVIPCYDKNGNLIGIRVRNMNNEIEPKYNSLKMLNGNDYKFPTNNYFYGENFNMANIERTKSVILVESEKTVQKFETWYGSSNNICLGLYGSALSKEKLKKLLEIGCDTFYIALDSDFDEIGDNKDYNDFENKVMKIYDLLKPYSSNIYVIYNNLGFKNCYKYSITDYTKEQFEQLWKSKERIDV